PRCQPILVRHQQMPSSESAWLSEHETCFDNAARLVNVRTSGTENRSRRRIGSMNNCEVSAQEKRVFAIGRRHGEGKGPAAWTIKQVDSAVADASRTLDVFRPCCQ